MSAKAILSASVSAPPVFVEDVFSTFLYTGNGSTQTITNGIDLSGKGGLVWIKGRSGATGHRFTDTARTATKSLASNSTAAEATESTGLTSFSSTGFAIGADADYSTNAATYCSWTFRKQPKFFDVVTYTGTGSNTTIAHNLGSVPGSIIVKRTDTTANWAVYHRSLANTQYLVLNSTATAATGATWWNSTTPTSSVFSVGTDASVNASGGTYVAYLFAHDAGGFGTAGTDNVVSCGSYAGNGAPGNFVNLGWEPQWLLIKNITGGTASWIIHDTMRGIVTNSSDAYLFADLASAENLAEVVSVNATGFTLEVTGSGWNGSANSYVYIAIRRGPMKTPTVGTSVYNAIARTGTGATATVTGAGFAPDFVLSKLRDFNFNPALFDRLRGALIKLSTNTTTAEASNADALVSFDMDGFTLGADTSSGQVNRTGNTIIHWNFRRAPGFFDVVAFKGSSSTFSVPHNLTVVPSLIFIKKRIDVSFTGFDGWWVLSSEFSGGFISGGSTSRLFLNTDAAAGIGASSVLNSLPTSTELSLLSANFNASNSFIAYLFATLAGVSKVGSYTGTGTTKQIDCGFTAGARFVMIKRTDSTGDWFVWDTARGIISGNDSYLLLNSLAAEVTGTDYIDPLASGFEISSTAPAAINANGGTYIFLAIS